MCFNKYDDHTSPDWRSNIDFIGRVVRHHGQALQFASEDLRSDPDLVLQLGQPSKLPVSGANFFCHQGLQPRTAIRNSETEVIGP